MSDWSGNDYLGELMQRPAARAPASFGEIWNTEWSRAGLDTLGGVGRPMMDARQELQDAISGASGMELADYAAQQGVNLAAGRSFDERNALLGQLAGTLPEEAKKKIEPLLDVRRNAAAKAQKIEADANDASAATYGLSGTATAWLAGLTRATVDPVNLAAMGITAPLGGPLEGALWKVLARQALAGGLAQAAVEPAIEPARAELGLDSGIGRAAKDVAGAAVGAAGLAGLFRWAGYALRLLRGRGTEAPKAEVQPAAATAQAPVGTEAEAGSAPGFVHDLNFAGAADARVQRGRLPAYEPGPSDVRPVDVTHEDLAALDRGRPLAHYGDAGALAAADLPGIGERLDFADGARAMRGLSADDLDAAAGLAERNQVIDAHAADARTGPVEHAERLAAASEAMERGDAAAATPASVKKRFGRAVQDPSTFSALEYLAHRGGLRNDDALISDLTGALGENPFIPGFGKLIRNPAELSTAAARGGRRAPMSLDDAVTALKEGGYLFDPSDRSGQPSTLTINDLIGLAGAEARGKKQYRLDYQPSPTRDPAQEKAFREEQRAAAAETFDARMRELGIGKTGQADRARALEIMRRENVEDPLAAYEQALLEAEQRAETARNARTAEAIDLPGWDLPDDAGGAPPHGEPAARGQPERPPGGSVRGGAREPGAGDREAAGGRVAGKPPGDPQLTADAARALDAAGGDLSIELDMPDGSSRKLSAREALAQAEEDARAAAEFTDCAGGGAVDAAGGTVGS